jgi:hypothetical protein
MITFIMMAAGVSGGLLVGAGALHLAPRLGSAGRGISDALCRAPALDLVITYFTVLPLIIGPIIGGWAGLSGAIVGQIAGLLIWQTLHELANRSAVKGPRIIKITSQKVGLVQNMVAVWITAIVTPMFWLVRMAQIFLYPMLTWLVRFPSYKEGEWVNVSRHKFSGLVGHDLIWCLYCDWMTGVWSLGTEMLRNVESFWCPIRFASDKKCANCRIDFPDIDGGWVPAEATMADVVRTLDEMYTPTGPNGWFGHRVRLTVGGKDPDAAQAVAAPQSVS